MKQYKYYTPIELAEVLVNLLPNKEYYSVVDISCGSWNLLKCAKKRLPNAEIIGVDIDKEAGKWQIDNSTFCCQDGREYSINCTRKFDLIVSNPPFGNLKEKERKFSTISDLPLIININRYENEMLLANLMLSNNDGTLLFILPSTFFEGESYLEVRKQIANEYIIETIARLPDNSFGSGKIHTYAIIITNRKSNNYNTKFMEIMNDDNSWTAKQLNCISIHQLQNGEWVNRNSKELSKGIIAFRGVISSGDFSSGGKKVLHSSSNIKNGEWHPSIRNCDKEQLLKNKKQADVGDFIINRIGKCAGYWTVCNEKAFVSDCILVIKKNDKIDIENRLRANTKDGKLKIHTYGLTTKYITKKDVISLL